MDKTLTCKNAATVAGLFLDCLYDGMGTAAVAKSEDRRFSEGIEPSVLVGTWNHFLYTGNDKMYFPLILQP